MTDPEIVTDFDLFWQAFPRRQAKKDALKAWRQLKPTTETVQAILDALAWQTKTEQWQRGIIPLPASYLRGERWTDEAPVSVLPARSLPPMPDKYAATADYHRRMRDGREGVH